MYRVYTYKKSKVIGKGYGGSIDIYVFISFLELVHGITKLSRTNINFARNF